MAAVETPARVSREVLEDRYDGALVHRTSLTKAGVSLKTAGDYNERRLRLDQILFELWEATARRDYPEEGEAGSSIDDISAMIRAEIIRRVDESGLAR